VKVVSSGTNVSNDDPTERQYFKNTLALLSRHNINHLAKDHSDQLTQNRIDGQDITVCMNQKVVDEANAIVKLPNTVINWNIVDIGEAHRTKESKRESYEEEIFQEITENVDKLVSTIEAYS